MMRSKLGLADPQKEDEKLITDLLDWMHKTKADFTNTFCHLGKPELSENELFKTDNFEIWHTRWQERLKKEPKGLDSSLSLMGTVNPAVIPRNHKVEEALTAGEQGDIEPFKRLLQAIERPYEDGDHLLPYQAQPKQTEKVYQTFCGT